MIGSMLTWCCSAISYLSCVSSRPIHCNGRDTYDVHCFRSEARYGHVQPCCIVAVVAGWEYELDKVERYVFGMQRCVPSEDDCSRHRRAHQV